jgi:adenylate cyclase
MSDKADGTDAAAGPVIGWRMKLFEQLKRFKGPVIAIASVGAVLSGLVGYWNAYRTVAVATPASTAATAARSPPHSLSVAVMPFIAADPGPTDAALAEVLGQSLAMALNQTRMAKVAAPGPVTTDTGKAFEARHIGRELSVRYIVLGETRTQGDKLGVTVRLVETENATQLWSERFEMAASPTNEQLSHLQGRLARHVVSAISGAAVDRAVRHPELSTPIDFVLRGYATTCGERQRVPYDKALQLDPDLVPAIVGRASVLLCEFQDGANAQREPMLAEMDALTAKAVGLDDRDASAWSARALTLAWRGRWGEAFAANEKAMALVPWSTRSVTDRAKLMMLTGQQSEAESLVLHAIEMDPPGSDYQFRYLCMARLLMGRYNEAMIDCERVGALNSWYGDQMLLAAIYAQRGETEKAALARAEVLKKQPGMTIANFWWARASDVPAYRQQLEEHLNAGLRKAGIPEK